MNILFFGPNGSGKGTQGAILKDKYQTPHIESGAIFRENISNGTNWGPRPKPTSTKAIWFRMTSPSP